MNTQLDKNIHIIPSQKDFDRAKAGYRRSDAQNNAAILKIKSIPKVLARGVAFKDYSWIDSVHYACKDHAKHLGASEEEIAKFELTIQAIRDHYSAIHEAKLKAQKDEVAATIPDGLVKYYNSPVKVKVKVRGRWRYGYVYNSYFMSTFHGTRFEFVESGTDKRFSLGETYSGCGGLDYYKAEARSIINHKVSAI